MKIGVYGGTFNPPHLGHAAAARAVVELLKLDRLLIIPAGLPPHKDLPAGSPTPEQRLEMTRLAADQLGLGDRVEVLDVEIHRHGKSYTADTLAALKARYPDDELWLLMGTDMFLTFQAWHEPERILSLAGTTLPTRFRMSLDKFRERPDAMKQAGIVYAAEQMVDLVANGVRGVHVYTMNKPDVAAGIAENLSKVLGRT